jgi:hypothetical protein
LDKKRKAGAVRFVLLAAPAEATLRSIEFADIPRLVG